MIENEEVHEIPDDWIIALMEKGVIVNIKVHYWRGKNKLTYKQLGLNFSSEEHQEFMQKNVSLGQIKLFPEKIVRDLELMERSIRKNLDAFSFSTVWGKFVPLEAYNDWREQHDDVVRGFYRTRDEIDNHYNEIIKESKENFKIMAKGNWRRINKDSEPPFSYINSFVNSIADNIPSREEIYNQFKLETTISVIPLPSVAREEIKKIEKIEIERELQEADRANKLTTRYIMEQEYREKKKELFDSFLNSTVRSIRKTVYDLSKSVCDSLQKCKKDEVNIQVVKKVKKMIKIVNRINFHDDEEINAVLRELEREVDLCKEERDKHVVDRQLKKLLKICQEEYLPKSYNPFLSPLDSF